MRFDRGSHFVPVQCHCTKIDLWNAAKADWTYMTEADETRYKSAIRFCKPSRTTVIVIVELLTNSGQEEAFVETIPSVLHQGKQHWKWALSGT